MSNSTLTNAQLRAKLLEHGFDLPISINRDFLLRKLEAVGASANPSPGRRSLAPAHEPTAEERRTLARAKNRFSVGVQPAEAAVRRHMQPAPVEQLHFANGHAEEEEDPKPPSDNPRRSERLSNYLNLFRNSPPAPTYSPRNFSDDEEEDESPGRPSARVRSYLNPFNWRSKPATPTPTPLTKYIRSSGQNGAPSRPTAASSHQRHTPYLDTPKVLLLVGLAFFAAIAGCYHYALRQPLAPEPPARYGKTEGGNYPICGMAGVEERHCISPSLVKHSLGLFNVLKEELIQRAGWVRCGAVGVEEELTLEEARTLLYRLSDMSKSTVDSALPGLLYLAAENPRWGVRVRGTNGPVNSYLEVDTLDPELRILTTGGVQSWACFLWVNMRMVAGWMLWGGGATLCLYLAAKLHFYYKNRRQREEEEVYEVVEQILELLRGHYEEARSSASDQFLAVNHIRDELFPPSQRSGKHRLWQRVEQYISGNESRIREEIQHISGEEYKVWRWLPQASPLAKRRSAAVAAGATVAAPADSKWQGQAFEICEGSPNSLPASTPTSCLKIRQMFDVGVGGGTSPETFSKIESAILEKCSDAHITHIGIDPHSQEGCVYIKCASREDARRVYLAMHGWWYEGHLLSVKFLREERYATRFPEVKGGGQGAALKKNY